MNILLSLPLLCITLAVAQTRSSQELDFVHGLTEYQDIRRMLPDYMEREGLAMVEARKRSLDVASPEALARRRQYVREYMLASMGGLPERTPLNARTVGTIARDGYRIEKVIFESQPNLQVTANLYLPATGAGPYPAVLFALGHERESKAFPEDQQILGTLARRGYVALTWDPIGQGERRRADVRDSTTEHTLLGIQAMLIGQAEARYVIWDGMRALDYLLSRKEVDPKRVAVTGNSGGGTQTAYLAALDDRLAAAAPSCYMTSWHWMLKSIGPQDAEQVFPGFLTAGLDYPDYMYAFGKPFLLLTAIRDFFPIDGARETYAEAERVFGDKLGIFESDDEHSYSPPRRLAAYNWFSRWLKGVEDHRPETPIEPLPADALNCAGGHAQGTDVFTIIRSRAEQLAAARSGNDVRRAAMERTHYKAPVGPFPVRTYGIIQRSGYRIEKLVYESEPGILIPALLYVPDAGPGRRPAVVMVDGRGKSACDPKAVELVGEGNVVLAIDPRGMGETGPETSEHGSEFDTYFGDFRDAMTAIMMNRPLPGMRARDIVRGVDLLAARSDVDAANIAGMGRGQGAVPLLYAAVFDQRLKSLAFEGMLDSYASITQTRIQKRTFESIVPGALVDFDLPDLVKALAPRHVNLSR